MDTPSIEKFPFPFFLFESTETRNNGGRKASDCVEEEKENVGGCIFNGQIPEKYSWETDVMWIAYFYAPPVHEFWNPVSTNQKN